MAQSYQSISTFPIIKTFTANQTWTDVTIPSKGRTITFGCETADIFVSVEGTEGGSTTGVGKAFIHTAGYLAIKKGRGTNQINTFQVATKSAASAEVTIIIEEE